MIQDMFNLIVDKKMIDRRALLLNGGRWWFVFDDPFDVISRHMSQILKEVLTNCSHQGVGKMVVSTFAMRRKWTIANKTLGLVVCCMWLRSTKIVHAALAIPCANLTTIPLVEELTVVVTEECHLIFTLLVFLTRLAEFSECVKEVLKVAIGKSVQVLVGPC